MRRQTSRSVQSTSGLYFQIPRRSSRSTGCAPARVGDCSRRMPVTQPSAPSSARSSAATLASPQQRSAVHSPRASRTSTSTPKRSSNARHVASVSSKRTPVSIVTTRAPGSSRTSASTSTDSSFWKEHSRTSPLPWRSTACSRTSSAVIASDRALALAADDLERHVLAPVDEVVHRLQAELDRHREVADDLLERRRPDALGEVVERLALLAVALVEAQPALDRLGDALGRQPHLESRAVDDLAVLVMAADVGHVRGDRVLADLDRRAVEADVGDVVLAASVRAAAHLDVDALGQLVRDVHRRDPLPHRGVEPHRARDAQLAAVGARARDDVVDALGAVLAQPEVHQAPPDVVQRLVADPAQDQVLADRRAHVPGTELARYVGHTAQLPGREVAPHDVDLDGAEALLPLGDDVGLAEAVELA